MFLWVLGFEGKESSHRGVVVYSFLDKGFGNIEVFGELIALTASVLPGTHERGEGNQFLNRPFVGAKFVLGAKIEGGIIRFLLQ